MGHFVAASERRPLAPQAAVTPVLEAAGDSARRIGCGRKTKGHVSSETDPLDLPLLPGTDSESPVLLADNESSSATRPTSVQSRPSSSTKVPYFSLTHSKIGCYLLHGDAMAQRIFAGVLLNKRGSERLLVAKSSISCLMTACEINLEVVPFSLQLYELPMLLVGLKR